MIIVGFAFIAIAALEELSLLSLAKTLRTTTAALAFIGAALILLWLWFEIEDYMHPLVAALALIVPVSSLLAGMNSEAKGKALHNAGVKQLLLKTNVRRIYEAMVWVDEKPGIRIELESSSIEHARVLISETYGENATASIWNEEDAAVPR